MSAEALQALQALQAALARIDHAAVNAEIAAIRTELAHVEAKESEVTEELRRLADRIQNFAAPSPEAIAAAVLAGAELADAAFAGETKAELEDRRDALRSSLGPIRARIDALRIELMDAEGRALRPLSEAVRPYVQHLHDRQRRAAEEVVQCDAALLAISRGLRCHIEHESASELARKALTGPASLLGLRDVLPVPEDLLSVLQPLAAASEAIKAIPASIPTR